MNFNFNLINCIFTFAIIFVSQWTIKKVRADLKKIFNYWMQRRFAAQLLSPVFVCINYWDNFVVIFVYINFILFKVKVIILTPAEDCPCFLFSDDRIFQGFLQGIVALGIAIWTWNCFIRNSRKKFCYEEELWCYY